MQARVKLALVLSSLLLAACSSSSNSPRAVPAPPATNDDGSQRLHRSGVVTLVRVRDQTETTINFTANAPNLRVRVDRKSVV